MNWRKNSPAVALYPDAVVGAGRRTWASMTMMAIRCAVMAVSERSGGAPVADIVPTVDIEAKVGAKRHPTNHLGRAVSAEQRVYILHSKECVARGIDLRKCEYSIALDTGIELLIWADFQDVPVVLGISDEYDDLEPLSVVAIVERGIS